MCDKASIRDPTFEEWIASFPDFIGEDEGKLYVINSPSDINKVHDDLFEILGE